MPEVHAELQQLGTELKTAWDEFKTTHAAEQEEIKTLGEASTETKATLEAINGRIDELDVRLQKTRIDGDRDELDRDRPEVKAFEKLLRQGPAALDEDEAKHIRLTNDDGSEKKSMILGDDTTGGFLAPTEIVNELIKGVVEFSPVRAIANVRSTSFHSIKAPKRTQVAGAEWVGEVSTRSETQNPKFGKEEISTRELSAMADLSRQDLEDTSIDLEQLVMDEFSEQFGVSEGTAFVSGDGVDGKPEGFLTASDQGYLSTNGIESIVSASNDTIVPDDLITLLYALKDSYARNATWVLKRATVAVVRKFKDENDQYLWSPGLGSLAEPTILGRPYVESLDMTGPSSGTTYSTGDLPIAVGDFRRGYWIVDRLAIQTLRDPYTQAASGNVRVWARKRVGGATVLTEAIKLLRVQ